MSSISQKYPTPFHFYSDIMNDGSMANTLLEDKITQFMPIAEPFANGAEMWKNKYATENKTIAFKTKYSMVSSWSAKAEDEVGSLLDTMGTYFARYRKSAPAVQQASRIEPPPAPMRAPEAVRRPVQEASSSSRPGRASVGLVMFLLAAGIYWATRKGK